MALKKNLEDTRPFTRLRYKALGFDTEKDDEGVCLLQFCSEDICVLLHVARNSKFLFFKINNYLKVF